MRSFLLSVWASLLTTSEPISNLYGILAGGYAIQSRSFNHSKMVEFQTSEVGADITPVNMTLCAPVDLQSMNSF
jgi:hypothetical protein